MGEDGAVYQRYSLHQSRSRPISSPHPVRRKKGVDIYVLTCTFASYKDIHSRNLETSWALDIHEERVWLGDDLLELVGSGLDIGGTVKEIDSESLVVSVTLL
jgi:hypothetical protein